MIFIQKKKANKFTIEFLRGSFYVYFGRSLFLIIKRSHPIEYSTSVIINNHNRSLCNFIQFNTTLLHIKHKKKEPPSVNDVWYINDCTSKQIIASGQINYARSLLLSRLCACVHLSHSTGRDIVIYAYFSINLYK